MYCCKCGKPDSEVGHISSKGNCRSCIQKAQKASGEASGKAMMLKRFKITIKRNIKVRAGK